MPKGNPNPSPATRFSADNPGRAKQKGARDRLSAAFLAGLADTFEEANAEGGTKGLDALRRVRDEDPATYLRVVASLQRQEVEVYRTPEERLKDDELEMVYQDQLAKIRAAKAADEETSIVPVPRSQVN